MSDDAGQGGDHIDRLRGQWRSELPELDTSPMAVIGRARRITLRLRPGIEAVFARHGLDAGEFDVISTLRRSGAPWRLTPTELYRTLMISSGGLTARLNRLEAAELIRRREAEEDKRSLLVELTEAGRAKAEAAFREDMALEKRLLAGLSAREQEELAVLLRKLALSLEGEGAGAS
ncbi:MULTISPECIES: MarR family transcriptional regulator [unclassified Bosea (in: a-proteobacteria)]|uniref:MarR family winged helix-turn-helix transcriptional regulator n=1 Tax=unclassified Bosea (in: a-proteobacteria) TaxID=2653178 RepID=UPI000F75DBD0|nr:MULTISPECIES: MarR family transcriptional regulator [unclassified Bosea (in: a-proteobacteria)]AZO77175.1 MarR family transcriptional regulator [Bosea sp. Tri-49]RXT22026.1 MarR family transcriptional regulator [Bosea sp. Tri-39]RXT32367.1 MarR family transcriptional regulator [Bosea sp. Tri-54]